MPPSSASLFFLRMLRDQRTENQIIAAMNAAYARTPTTMPVTAPPLIWRGSVLESPRPSATFPVSMSIDWRSLYAAADAARKKAHAPYSKFAVGEAVLAT